MAGKKVPSRHPGQTLDFPFGQLTCYFHLPDGQEVKQVMCQLHY